MSLENINLGTTANDGTGDDLRSAGEKINAAIEALNLLGVSIIPNLKYQIFAHGMLPLTTNSAYYLESDLFPSQVFSHTVTEGVKISIPEYMVPTGTTPKLKVKFQAFHTYTGAPSDAFDVAWEVAAAWIVDGAETVTLGVEQYAVMTVETDPLKLKWSGQTPLVTPGGIREAGAELRIRIRRNVAYRIEESLQDTLDVSAHLYKVEIRWEV